MVLAVAVKQSCSLSFCFLLVGLVWATIGSNSNLSCSALSVPVKQQWKPKVANLEERRKLRGQVNDSEKIGTKAFHHVEFYCGDAKSTAHRFASALGMPITGTSGQHTGNDKCVSYGLESGQVRFLLTAPYSQAMSSKPTDLSSTQAPVTASTQIDDAPNPLPNFSPADAHQFFAKHGMAVRAVGLEVKDAQASFDTSVANGARPVLEPTFVPTCHGQSQKGQTGSGCYMAEVALYGDVVLRYLSFHDAESSSSNKKPLPFLPHLAPVEGKMAERKTFGLRAIDHAVGNVPNLFETLSDISAFTGFHHFAEFESEDVGTVESGLNSVVLASDSEDVLFPLNEPVNGKRKSQIQTYLEQNEGAGLQHLALKTDDIFETLTLMREAEEDFSGFDLMKRPSDEYYRELPERLGDKLTPEQFVKLEELGILADADDEGVLLQIFTKPIGDRPTFFFEIIQRIGCLYTPVGAETQVERSGCGGFGSGNFKELFRAIEEHEKTLKV